MNSGLTWSEYITLQYPANGYQKKNEALLQKELSEEIKESTSMNMRNKIL